MPESADPGPHTPKLQVVPATPERVPADDQGPGPGIATLIGAVRRRMPLAASVFFALALTTVSILMLQPPHYAADTTVLIDPRTKEVVDFESVLSGLNPDSAIVDTEVKLIRSRNLIADVVETMRLEEDPEFNHALRPPGPLAKLSQSIRSTLMGLAPHQVRQQEHGRKPTADQRGIVRQRVVERVSKRLGVRRDGLTYLIHISFRSTDPAKAARIADAFAEQYLREQLDAKFDATARANDWLSGRLSKLREELRLAENLVENFRARSGLLSVEGHSLTEQQVSDLNRQLIEQRARLAEAQARFDSVRDKLTRGADPETIGEVLASPVIGELRRQAAEISRQHGELSARYGPQHPRMIKTDREVADIQRQIDSEVRRIRLNLKAEVEIERRKVLSLQNALAQLRAELESNNKALVRLRELQRDAEASRLLYENFLNRSKQTGEQESLTEADGRVISHAAIPTEVTFPKPLFILALALWMGLLGAGMAVAGAEILDNGLSGGPQVESELGLAHIASVPALNATGTGAVRDRILKGALPSINPVEYVLDQPVSSFAESFRTIRASIQLASLDRRPRVIAVTSALPGEGKTTVSYCLGRTSATAGHSAIVVDCDPRRRSLTQTALASPPRHGLLELLSGGAEYADVVKRDVRCDLDILPVAKAEFTPKDLFGSEAFRTLLQNLSQRYQLVILDTAPILAVAEVRTIAYYADALFLVAKWRKTGIPAVRAAAQALQGVNARTAGVILSQVDQSQSRRFGEGDYNYYHKQYRDYYSEKPAPRAAMG